jgi:hypothetical protein
MLTATSVGREWHPQIHSWRRVSTLYPADVRESWDPLGWEHLRLRVAVTPSHSMGSVPLRKGA